jgi:leader peptidase (prepilin peptidase) / N-methyltransferase
VIAISLGLALVSVLVTVTVTDLERRVIPNAILAAGAVAGLAIVVPADPSSLPERAVAAVGAGGFLWLGTLRGRDGMGMGDVKLAALMGLYLGAAVVASLAVAFAAGAVVGLVLVLRHGAAARKRAIPFGPFLAAGGVLGLWAGDPVVEWYLEAFLRD